MDKLISIGACLISLIVGIVLIFGQEYIRIWAKQRKVIIYLDIQRNWECEMCIAGIFWVLMGITGMIVLLSKT